MKTILQKILLLVSVMMIGGSAWATTYKLTQVTSSSGLTNGAKYVLKQGNNVLTTVDSKTHAIQTTTSFSTTGLAGTESYVVTLEKKTSETTYYIKTSDGYYLGNSSSTDIKTSSTKQDAVAWSFNFQDNNTVKIQNSSNSDRFLGNNGSNAYKAYATGGENSYPWQFVVYILEDENAVSINAADVNITANDLSGFISYTITNEGGSSLTASKKSGDWLTVGAVDEGIGKVAFSALQNTTDESREAVVTLTYGTASKDVTITQAAATYPVHFSVNGTITSTASYQKDEDIAFPDNPASVAGKVFVGWITSPINECQDTAPAELVTSGSMGNEETTYYAVFATSIAGPVGFLRYERVTEAPSDWSGVYVLSSGTTIFNGQNGSNAYGSYITAVPGTTEQTACEVTITKTSKAYSAFHNASSKYLGLTSDNNALDFASEYSSSYQYYDWIPSVEHGLQSAKYTSRNLEYNSTYTRYACYGNTQADVFLYKRIEGAAITYSAYCTTITITTPAVTEAGWGTYVTPYNMEFADNEAYVVTAVGDNVTLQSVTKVRAGVPVVLKGVGAKTATALNEAPAAIANKLAVSTGGAVDGYVLSNKNSKVGFYKWTGGSLAEGKVYLPTSAVSSAREFVGFDETMGISAVKSNEATGNKSYNLAGQRIVQPSKGLYIVNGKKVVIAK